MTCIFAAPGRQVGCLSLMKQRQAAMTREHDTNEYYSCPQRRKRLEGEKPPERINIPPASIDGRPIESRRHISKPVIPTEKKEAPVATDLKERVLETITRRQPCASAVLLQNLRIPAAELNPMLEALQKEGKIKSWKAPSKDFAGRTVNFKTLYTLPDAPNPFPAETFATPASPAEGKTGSATPEPAVRNRKKSAASRVACATAPVTSPVASGSPYASAIAALEAKRAQINQALEALRALA